MAGLKITLDADLQKFKKLREEMAKLKEEMTSIPASSPKMKNLLKEYESMKKQMFETAQRAAYLESALRNIDASNKTVSSAKEITKATEEATTKFKEEADSLAALERQAKSLTKEWLSMSQATRKSDPGIGTANQIATINAQRKIEADGLRALQKEYVNTKKIQELQEGSIASLRAQLSKLTASYDNLGRSMRKSDAGKELLGNIQLVSNELNEAEQASMRFQRNVGNYKSGFNGLNMSIQQVARELPSLTMGANMFFLAISNNLPILGDNLKMARKEYKDLVEEGKTATPVWKQVVSSLFSWQTALVAGITILSMYGKEIISWVGSLFTTKKALSETYQSLDDFQKKVGDTSGSVIATLQRLSDGWKRLGGDIDAQKKFIQDNKDAIDNMGVSVTNAAEAERVFNTNKDQFILGILQRAKAAATMELAAEEYKKAVQKMMEADEKAAEGVSFVDKLKSWFVKSASVEDTSGTLLNADLSPEAFAKDREEKLRKQSEELFKSGTELIQKYAQFSEEERKTLESIGIKTTQTLIEGSIEAIEASIALKEQALKKVTDAKEYKRIEAEIKAEQSKLKAITGEKEKKFSYVDSYGQVKEIEKASQLIKDAIIKSEIDIQQQMIDLKEEGSEKQLAQIRLDYDKRFQEIQKEERDLLQKLQEEERKLWEKNNPDYKKKNLQFTPTVSLTPEQNSQFEKQYSLAYEKQEKSTQALLKNLLDKYKDYDAQRTDIENKGNDDIAALQSQRTDNNSNEIDRAIAEAKKKVKEGIQSINDIQAAESTKDNNFFKLLFGDYSKMSFNELQNLISQAKQLREYLSGNGTAEGITFISPKQLKAITQSPAELDKLKKALDKLLYTGKEGNNNKWEGIFTSFKKGIAGLNGAKGFKEISGAIGTISGAASSAAGELSNMFEQMGNTEVADALSGIQQVMSAVSNIGEGFAKGGPLGGIGAAVGEAMNLIGKAFAANARHKEALKEIMKEALSQQREYNLLLMQQNLEYEKASTIFGADMYSKAANAVKVARDAVSELNKELEGTQAQKKKQSSDALIKKLFGVSNPQEELKKAYAGLANIEVKTGHKKTGLFGWGKGKDIYSSILEVYPKLIEENGKFNASLAETIINTRTMSEEDKARLQNMIDLSKQAEEALKVIKDYLTGIFGELGSTMNDALVDAFKNGKDAAKSFTDSVSDMLETLAKQMIYSVTLAPLMEKAQKGMMDIMQNTGLSEEQRFSQWTGVLNNLVDDAIANQDVAYKLMEEYQRKAKDKGFDIFKPELKGQDSTKRGFETMSQDTGSELNGRFTALQIAGEGILNQSMLTNEWLSKMYSVMSATNMPDIATSSKNLIENNYQSPTNISFPSDEIKVLTGEVSSLKGIVNEMRDLQASGNLHRQEIADNTAVLAKNSPKLVSNTEEMRRDLKKL